ncbi:trinucleotide repeat-containing gene 18 protein-like [Pecten maximus]|uniref:trinucleotide repeat-containing gene 18 protein-like n=1 Tax=Pecten maximus TaxID=6579 RepID=UPI0014585C89|nr:trinucleotide repeat-containing gene 18 protein-like [Pecten maximus]
MITRKTLFAVWITLLSCCIPMLSGQGGGFTGFLDNFSTVSGAMNAFQPAPASSGSLEWPTSNAFPSDQTGTGPREQQHAHHGHGHEGHAGHNSGATTGHSNHEHVGNPVGINQFVSVDTPSSQTPTREELLETRRRQEWDRRNGIGADAFVSDPQPVESNHQHNPSGNPMTVDHGPRSGPGVPPTDPSQIGPTSNPGLDPSNPNLTREQRRELRRQGRRDRRRNRNRNNLDPSSTTGTEGDTPMTRRERRRQERQERLQQRWDRQERRRLERLGQGPQDPQGSAGPQGPPDPPGPADAHVHTTEPGSTLDQRPRRRNRNRGTELEEK